MTELELAWLAGLLEGEGSFSHPPPSEPKSPRIAVSMTDEDVIQRAARLLGVKYMHIRRDDQKPHWKPAYRIQVKGTRAVTLMRQLRPLMGQRRGARIDSILADLDGTPPPRRLTEHEARAILSKKNQARARDVAAEYDLSIKTVEMIWRGARWGHLQPASTLATDC